MTLPAVPFAGMWQIVRFNRWFYVAALLGLIVDTVLLCLWPPSAMRWAMVVGLAVGAWWVLGSLVVSHWIYDRSDWPTGAWLEALVGDDTPKKLLNVHCGFDETTVRLCSWRPDSEVTALDLFDPSLHTESSLLRARAFKPPLPGSLAGTVNCWPVEPGSVDAVCLLLTAHEFRQQKDRITLLREARRVLSDNPPGCIVLAEHVRDPANFLAFGPGFLHFHSAATWREAWGSAGLAPSAEFRVTPFVRVWRLAPSEEVPR